jgi:head-tail adaptor
MRAGDLRSRIRIERKAAIEDPEFGPSGDQWVLFAEVWAEIEDQLQPRSESSVQGLRVATDQVRIRIRFREGITSAMRVVELNGMKRTLQITAGPSMTKWREEMEMMAEAYSS